MRLFGRETPRATLDEILTAATGGRSAALVLRGEPAVGKTALLRYAESHATACLWISGMESESGFPYAALHRLLIPLLPDRDHLPPPWRSPAAWPTDRHRIGSWSASRPRPCSPARPGSAWSTTH